MVPTDRYQPISLHLLTISSGFRIRFTDIMSRNNFSSLVIMCNKLILLVPSCWKRRSSRFERFSGTTILRFLLSVAMWKPLLLGYGNYFELALLGQPLVNSRHAQDMVFCCAICKFRQFLNVNLQIDCDVILVNL